jgi:hypothetical protein
MWEKVKRKERSPQEEETNRKNARMDEELDTSFDFCQRLTKMMEGYKEKVSTTLSLMDMQAKPSNDDIKKWMTALAKVQVNGMDEMACMVSEVVEEMDSLHQEVKTKDKEIRKLREQLEEQSTVVSTVVVTKDKLEVKASSKEMEERLKIATTQFKVMDVDIGKETENRTEILTRGVESGILL